ncbi:hypothetical protein LCGC14_3143000 [marine sediment metagenome]|uniref:Uncharacterized protein n=1 Tax=marine sediment metagenome TaxID=412755 RepID=A0A0F8VW88_9ZZZZ
MISDHDFRNLEVGDMVKLDQPAINSNHAWWLLCPYATVTNAGRWFSVRISYATIMPDTLEESFYNYYEVPRRYILHQVERLINE